ncbi:MAG: hypothetical protein ACFCA4_01215 [Cyanophyceae cyanobacterium]
MAILTLSFDFLWTLFRAGIWVVVLVGGCLSPEVGSGLGNRPVNNFDGWLRRKG